MTTDPLCLENVALPIALVSPRGEPFITNFGKSGPCNRPKSDHCNLLAPMLPKGHTATCKKIHGHAFVPAEE